MACELSVLFGTPLTEQSSKPIDTIPGVDVTLDEATGTRAYHAVTIEGVRAEPSPEWMRARLEALGREVQP